MPDLTGAALIVVGGVVVLLFGGPKVVEWARHIGRAKRAYAEELGTAPASPPTATRP